MAEQKKDRDQDQMRRRVEAASPGEPASGLEAESGDPGEGRGDVHAAERPEPDEVTEADKEAQTRRAERVQQSGDGIRGYKTGEGREDHGSEEEIRRAAEGEE